MTRQPQGRAARRPAADPGPDRRSWLSQGFAALGISALGLAIAGSMSLTTSAQPMTAGDAPITSASTPADAASSAAGTVDGSVPGAAKAGAGAGTSSVSQPAAAQAFLARDPGVDTSRSEQLRAALAKERAAQRAEDLAKTAEQVTRAVRDQASKARKNTLDATERQIQENAVKLAWARQQRAIAARVAAGNAVATATDSTSTTADPGNTTIPTGGTAVAPVPGAVVGARFGQYGLWSRYHTGLDFRAAAGTPIRAVLPGVVVFAGNVGDWSGNHVAIRHAGGVTTMSSHMSRIAVSAGQSVSAGQIIGYVGETGRAFGPHLHFELYPAGVKYGDVYRAIDPQPWLRAHGLQTH
ncbi:M23 family metallopeptidase [Microlunatus ginsengisoli]|uniref:M23 family metallopeptidase n=1 Tax=Microlunatus ginsengisoli TaxID=363863 RepID=UPI0031D4C092